MLTDGRGEWSSGEGEVLLLSLAGSWHAQRLRHWVRRQGQFDPSQYRKESGQGRLSVRKGGCLARKLTRWWR